MRIIAQYFKGHWLAWFDDSSPDTFGGPDAFAAIQRLLENSPARHLTLDDFEPDLDECRLNRVVMVLKDRDRDDGSTGQGQAINEPCPECGGTGRYIGLTVVESCGACGGVGSWPISRLKAETGESE